MTDERTGDAIGHLNVGADAGDGATNTVFFPDGPEAEG